jgi:hypothetical protein
VDELVITDRILLEGDDLTIILHHHSDLGSLGSWSSADIEDSISRLWIEDIGWEHRCE